MYVGENMNNDNSFQQIEYYKACPQCREVGNNKEICEKCGASMVKEVTKGYLGKFYKNENIDYQELNKIVFKNETLEKDEPKKKKHLLVISLVALLFVVLGGIVITGITLVNRQNRKLDNVENALADGEDAEKNELRLEAERSSFNSTYEFYQGECEGMEVGFLLSNIIDTSRERERNISVSFEGTEAGSVKELMDIKENIDSFKKYDITLGYDRDGFVNEIIIK